MSDLPFPEAALHTAGSAMSRHFASLGWAISTEPGAAFSLARTDILAVPEVRYGRLDGEPALFVMRFVAPAVSLGWQLGPALLAANEWNRRSPVLRAHVGRADDRARWVLDASTVWSDDDAAIGQFVHAVVEGVRAFAANTALPLMPAT